MTALGAALHVDVALAADPRPIEAFLEAVVPDPRGFKQFCVPVAPRRERPSAYRREKLMARVRADELFSFLVETPVETPDEDAVIAGVRLQPTSSAYGRCEITLAVGSGVLARRGAQELVDAVVALADAVDPCGGVVFPAETTLFASMLATGGGGSGLTPEQDRRTRDENYVLHWLGDKARGPAWGTFLTAAHVATLGGAGRVSAESGCEVVCDLAGGGMYLQRTATWPRGDVELALLRAFLAPVVLDPATLP